MACLIRLVAFRWGGASTNVHFRRVSVHWEHGGPSGPMVHRSFDERHLSHGLFLRDLGGREPSGVVGCDMEHNKSRRGSRPAKGMLYGQQSVH